MPANRQHQQFTAVSTGLRVIMDGPGTCNGSKQSSSIVEELVCEESLWAEEVKCVTHTTRSPGGIIYKVDADKVDALVPEDPVVK
jgi:hypothetical protein